MDKENGRSFEKYRLNIKKVKKKKKKGLTVTLVPDNNTRTAHYAVVSV